MSQESGQLKKDLGITFPYEDIVQQMERLKSSTELSGLLATNDIEYRQALSFLHHGSETGTFVFQGFHFERSTIEILVMLAAMDRKEQQQFTDLEEKDGVYAWLYTDVPKPGFVLLPTLEEDVGKKEMIDALEMRPLALGMLGTLSGGVDEEDLNPTQTVIREAMQELNLSLSENQITNDLPHFEVIQTRGGKLYEVRALGHKVTLTPEQYNQLISKYNGQFVPRKDFREFLIKEEKRIRPHVYKAGLLLAQRWGI
jgi:8-oxo-dGTP pyrophosphatase MutT (NUDIX family)